MARLGQSHLKKLQRGQHGRREAGRKLGMGWLWARVVVGCHGEQWWVLDRF